MLCVTVASTIAALGMDLVQQRFIPNLRAEGRDAEADGLIGATTRLSMAAAFIAGLLLFGYLEGRAEASCRHRRRHPDSS